MLIEGGIWHIPDPLLQLILTKERGKLGTCQTALLHLLVVEQRRD